MDLSHGQRQGRSFLFSSEVAGNDFGGDETAHLWQRIGQRSALTVTGSPARTGIVLIGTEPIPATAPWVNAC